MSCFDGVRFVFGRFFLYWHFLEVTQKPFFLYERWETSPFTPTLFFYELWSWYQTKGPVPYLSLESSRAVARRLWPDDRRAESCALQVDWSEPRSQVSATTLGNWTRWSFAGTLDTHTHTHTLLRSQVILSVGVLTRGPKPSISPLACTDAHTSIDKLPISRLHCYYRVRHRLVNMWILV